MDGIWLAPFVALGGSMRKPGPKALGAKVPAIQVFYTAAGVVMTIGRMSLRRPTPLR